MTIDKLTVTKQTTIAGPQSSIAYQVTADNVSEEDARIADVAFDIFMGTISGKPKPVAHEYRRAYTYTAEEEAVVMEAPDQYSAFDHYKSKFPNTQRSRDAVRKKWSDLHNKPVAVEEPASIPRNEEKKPAPAAQPSSPPKKATKKQVSEVNKKNAQVPQWTDEQKDLVSKCNTKEEAWDQFQERFPGQRNANAVFQRFYILKTKAQKDAKKAAAASTPLPDNSESKPAVSDADKTPSDTQPPAGPEKKDVVKRPVILGIGTTVKHNGQKSSPFFGKEGRIVKMGTGMQVLVNFGDSSQWLATSAVIAVAG